MATTYFATRSIAKKKMEAHPESWVFETISDIYHRNANIFGDREAFSCGEERLTWAEADRQCTNLAVRLIRKGFVRDDVLIIWLPSTISSYLLRAACDRAGIVFCVPAMAMGEAEIRNAVQQTGAKGIVFPERWRDRDYTGFIRSLQREFPHLEHGFAHARAGEDRAEDFWDIDAMRRDVCRDTDWLTKLHGFRSDESVMLSLTGGTTGAPKLVETAYGARLTVYYHLCGERYRASASDVIGAVYHHPHGPMSQTFQGAALFGAKVAILDDDRFEAESAIRFLSRERVTWLPIVPTLLRRIIETPGVERLVEENDLSALRLIVPSGSALPVDIARPAEELLKARVVNHFGMSDALGLFSPDFDDAPEIRWTTVGKMVRGGELRLLRDDEEAADGGAQCIGEISVRGPFVVAAYFNEPDATKKVWTEDGWFMSGDLGLVDADGNVRLVGRKKDLIIRGGQNIYPSEIEDVIRNLDIVDDVAVVGAPDAEMGEVVCAFVVPKDGEPVTAELVCARMKSRGVASFKLPALVECIDQIPRTPEALKTDKKALRDLAAQRRAAAE